MILNWMIASALFGGIVALAAILAERALASAGRGRRTPWVLALGVAVAWPLAAGLWYLLRPVEEPMAIIRTRIGSTAARIVADQIVATGGWGPAAETALVVAWGAVTLLLLTRIAVAIHRMRVVTRAAERLTMDGTPVLLSDTAGPAVCGAVFPQIVLPRWILELDAPLREIVVRHEREHVAHGDARTVLGAAIAVALVPWSPAVWMMYRRLRLAVELDCDARVLVAHDDASRYSRLLMLVAQRQTHTRLQPMLAESSAHLERRITEMHTTTTRSRVRAAALGTLSAMAVIIACSSPVMAGIITPPPEPPDLFNDVLKLPAVQTTARAPRVKNIVVKLTTQGQGKPRTPPPPPPKYELVAVPVSPGASEAEHTQRPRYPDILRQAGVEGAVTVQLIVEADGTVMPGSMKVLSSTHQLFVEAVRSAVPGMRYNPAKVEGRAVRQLIQQEFEFNVDGSQRSLELIRGPGDSAKAPSALKLNKVVVTVPDLRKP